MRQREGLVRVLDYRRVRNGLSDRALRVVRAAGELLLIAVLYVAYSASRLLADDDVAAAKLRAHHLLSLEQRFHVAWEHAAVRMFVDHGWLGVFADYWYASAHYVVTVVVLVWLWRRGREVYVPARRALAAATVLGLACYLMLPTAPPRLDGGFVDLMKLHASAGWWGSDASAPRGLGGLTNELAAFPSLHAGWSLWVALAVWSATRSVVARSAAVAHALITATVVVGTANHWTLDVLVGWLVVVVGWLLSRAWTRRASAAPNPGDGVLEWHCRPAGRPAADSALRRPDVAARPAFSDFETPDRELSA